VFRRERRNRFERYGRAFVERVADCEHARIGQTHDVAGVGRVERLALVREQAHGARETHVFAGARVANDHVALEPAEQTRTNATRSRWRGSMFAWILKRSR